MTSNSLDNQITGNSSPSKSLKKSSMRRRKKHGHSYSIYIYKIIKQVHPEIGVTKKSMAIFNSYVDDIFYRICNESKSLVLHRNKQTISAHDVLL